MKFGDKDWGGRVKMQNPPDDKLLDEYGLLLGAHPTEHGRVVVLSERRYHERDDGLRICDEDYIHLEEK